jgi:hypothetical protein
VTNEIEKDGNKEKTGKNKRKITEKGSRAKCRGKDK